jgi:uncharacterized Zn-binding protein involved in type VI secretion
VVVFDDSTIIDLSTPATPHQLSRGVEQLFVNGVQVVRDGRQTAATPGKVLRRHQESRTNRVSVAGRAAARGGSASCCRFTVLDNVQALLRFGSASAPVDPNLRFVLLRTD